MDKDPMEKILLDKLIELEIKYDKMKTQVAELENQISTMMKNQVIETPLVKKETGTKQVGIGILLGWCKETVDDYNKRYLPNKNRILGQCCCILNRFQRPAIIVQPLKHHDFENYRSINSTPGRGFDLVYHEDNYKILIGTKYGINKEKQDRVRQSIQAMIDKGEFVRVNFKD